MRDARGFTLIELLIVATILGILLSVAIANYRHARMRGDEAAAMAALTAINQAQYSFMQTCGNQHFAPHLTSLGKPNPNTTAPFLSPDLTVADEIVKSGYVIQMAGSEEVATVQTCTGEVPVEAYQATADPAVPGTTGLRSFGTNVDLVIYEDLQKMAGTMPEHGAPRSGAEVRALPAK